MKISLLRILLAATLLMSGISCLAFDSGSPLPAPVPNPPCQARAGQ